MGVAKAVVIVARRAAVADINARFGITICHQQDGVRIRNRKRPKEHRIHYWEGSGVRGDTNRNGSKKPIMLALTNVRGSVPAAIYRVPHDPPVHNQL